MPNDEDDRPYTPPLRGKVALMASRPVPCDDAGAGAGEKPLYVDNAVYAQEAVAKKLSARERLAARAPELVDAMFSLALDTPLEALEGEALAGYAAKREALKLAATYALRKPAPEKPEEGDGGDDLLSRLARVLAKDEDDGETD